MIKANEIRVGNWLNDPRPLTEFNKKYVNNPDNGYFIATARDIQFAEEFEPITLTEEILLKCGFKKNEVKGVVGLDEYNDEENTIFYTIVKNSYNDFTIVQWGKDTPLFYSNSDWTRIKLNSLHQLQNLYFALKGQELEINL